MRARGTVEGEGGGEKEEMGGEGEAEEGRCCCWLMRVGGEE